MPLTDEQRAAVTLIAGADKKEVADALKNDANSVYNVIFGAGVTTGKNDAKTSAATLQADLDAEKEARTAAEQERDDLKAKTPDRAEIDRQWQEREAKKLADKDKEIAARDARIARLTTDTTYEKAHSAALLKGLKPRAAHWYAKDAVQQVRYNDQMQAELLEPGTEIPVQIPAGQNVFDVWAERVVAAADPDDIASRADRGGGSGGGAGGGGGKTAAQIEQERRNSGAYATF